MRPASLLAVAASAVVGLACGIGGGLLIGNGSYPDPVGLGVALHNQDCTGKTLVMLGWGGRRPPLAAGVQENPQHARYLDTRQSCDTAWSLNGRPDPRYVVYLGPFDTGAQACQVRMTATYKGDLVTSLVSGHTQPVECTCYLPVASMPLLRTGMTPDPVDTIWIRSLQRILSDLGYLPADQISGNYLPATVEAVKQFQSERGGLAPNGVVGPTTWQSLITKGCHLYNS